MKNQTASRKLRRPPPGGGTIPASAQPKRHGPVAGGPSTRLGAKLGPFLAEVLAYFEERVVTPREIELLWPTHRNGWLRPQIEDKLGQLHPHCPDHRQLHRLVTLCLDLLTAVDEGRFEPGPDWPEVEPRVLRALAYFLKEGDAIPDHLPAGFDDDMREFSELAQRTTDLFDRFECGRTRPSSASGA